MEKITTCIIMDDESIYLFLHKKIISMLLDDISIIEFPNALEGLNYILTNYSKCTHNPTLILLDLNMPVMSGKEFLKRFTDLDEKIKEQIKIAVVSASIEDLFMDKEFLLSFDSIVCKIIHKPLTLLDMEIMLNTLV